MQKNIRPICENDHKKRFNTSKFASFIILLIVCFIWILPLVWMFGTSLKTDSELILNPLSLFPTMGVNLEHYKAFFNFKATDANGAAGYFNIMVWVRNSAIVAVLSVVLSLSIYCLAAYAFVFLDFKYKKLAWALILGSMTIPGVATYVAKYAMLMQLGKAFDYNGIYLYACIILPGTCGVFNLFLVRQFFLSIPKDLVESAKIDGASNMKIFLNIILPISKSVLFVTGMFAFIGAWNGYEWPQLILSGNVNQEVWGLLTPGLASWASGGSTTYMGRTMAAATISTIPVIIIYCFCQNRIIDGIATTGVKR